MPTIRFVKNRKPIEIEHGYNLMDALLEAGLPVASSCHGDGVCAKCRIEILEGAENLSQPSDLENMLKLKNPMPPNFRISCQTQILGDILIDTGYW